MMIKIKANKYIIDGITVLSASNLTTRIWSGSLCCFKSIPDGIPNIAQCAGFITIDSPASCLKILPNSKRFLCGCDNGLYKINLNSLIL